MPIGILVWWAEPQNPANPRAVPRMEPRMEASSSSVECSIPVRRIRISTASEFGRLISYPRRGEASRRQSRAWDAAADPAGCARDSRRATSWQKFRIRRLIVAFVAKAIERSAYAILITSSYEGFILFAPFKSNQDSRDPLKSCLALGRSSNLFRPAGPVGRWRLQQATKRCRRAFELLQNPEGNS